MHFQEVDPDAGKDWGQEEKGTTEDEMAGWHHRLNGHGFEWTSGVDDGQGGLVCCSSWGHKESDRTERLNRTDNSTWEQDVGTQRQTFAPTRWAYFPCIFSLFHVLISCHHTHTHTHTHMLSWRNPYQLEAIFCSAQWNATIFKPLRTGVEERCMGWKVGGG